MKIWQSEVNLEIIAVRSRNTLLEHLGIEFTAVGDDYLRAKMPVDHRTKQPLGILHGGASCVLAESIGSTAAAFCVDQTKFYCVGLDININHIRSVKDGYVNGTAKPFHLGKSTQVWNIEITDLQDKLIAVSRLTMAVLSRS